MKKIKSIIVQDKVLICRTLLFTFIIGLIAHGYAFFNGLFSHDSLKVYPDKNEIIWHISLGRFLQEPYRICRGELAAPWLIGLMSLLWISVTAYLIIKLLKIKTVIMQFATCGILAVNLTTISINATYMFYIDIFMFALLMAVLAVFFVEKVKFGIFWGAIFICISMGLYQSFFAVAVTLFIMLSIDHIVRGDSTKNVIKSGAYEVGSLLLGGILYMVLLRIVLKYTNVDLSNGYNGIANVVSGKITVDSIPKLIVSTYTYYLNFLFKPNGYGGKGIVIINMLCVILLIGSFIQLVYKNKVGKVNIAIGCFLLLLFPFASNLTYFISQGMVHMLMVYSWFLIYPFALFLIERQSYAKLLAKYQVPLKVFSCMLVGIMVWNGVIYANGAYLKKTLEEKSTLSVATRVLERIETTDGYVAGETPVAFVGNINDSVLSVTREGFERYTDTYSIGMTYNYGITYGIGMAEKYFSVQLGYPINFVNQEEIGSLSQSDEVITMPCFPEVGSVKFVGNVLVVKFSQG